jgi:hypothetical protein
MTPYPHANLEKSDGGGGRGAGQNDAEVPDGAEVVHGVDIDCDMVTVGGDL